MPLFLQALVMGIVQGLTEFLPISSSGHLIVVPALLGWNDPFIDSLLFSVMLHMGTLVALIVYFARDWLDLIPALVGLVRDRSTAGDPDRRLVLNLVLATIPAAIAGALLNDVVERTVRQPTLVAILLVVGAAILWFADRVGKKLYGMDGLSGVQAFVIGVAQAFALLPGVSRSGISIAMGLLTGLDREAAARFSFLMATPIIAGAGIFEARKLFGPEAPPASDVALVAIGFVASLVAGLVAIRFMLGYLRTNTLGIFVLYRVALAAIVLVALFGR
jgi:undecaprenyl-diphosphatase